jgi:geranylgeranyl diphosphate synthase type II
LIQENDFQKLYTKLQTKVESVLNTSLKGRLPVSLYEPAEYILNSPGKRLRPFLVLISAKAVGGDYSKAYNAAAAVEVLHNFTLVHDDIMDNADKRRGRLTVHKKYDLSTAILVGDILASVAYELLLKDAKTNINRIVSTFNRGVAEVCEGQGLDKEFETASIVTMDQYLEMITKKTAALAEMCCSVGAQIGGGTEAEIKALSKYGKYLGIAFQIQDDLLDIIADEKDFGKKIGGDLVEGKKTFLFIKALEKAKGKHKKDLMRVIKNKGIEPADVNYYKNLYIELGILNDAVSEIKRYTQLALKGINQLKNEEYRRVFITLANLLIKRSK